MKKTLLNIFIIFEPFYPDKPTNYNTIETQHQNSTVWIQRGHIWCKTQVIGKVASQLGNNGKQPGGSSAECERVGCCRVATNLQVFGANLSRPRASRDTRHVITFSSNHAILYILLDYTQDSSCKKIIPKKTTYKRY